ncbi:armadillo-type protein [Lipomyces arxii]|uniref:armadillo-type protein n=1 Tax=Lipomyces arxii TaxID=56418 RepID=UPI0034CD1139
MQALPSSSFDDELDDPDHFLPLEFLDSPVEASPPLPSSTPPVGRRRVIPLQIDTNAANLTPQSPTRAEREAMLQHLNNQVKLIEMQKRAILTQTAYDDSAQDDNNDTSAFDFRQLKCELQAEDQNAPDIMSSKSNQNAPFESRRTNSGLWTQPEYAQSDQPSSLPTVSGDALTSQLSAEYAPLGGSIWRRMSAASPLFVPQQQQQQQPPAARPATKQSGLLRSHSMSLASPPTLPSPIEGKWSAQPVTARKRNQTSTGVSSSTVWSAGATQSSVSAASYSQMATSLLPHSWEFPPSGTGANDEFCSPSASTQSSSYMTLTEPINYRQLLERSVNCNWSYIVEKIVNSNDQQASIFLQQKLKIGSAEQRYSIIEAIVEQAYPLMINRFGNFLVQRCFEHGTPEQINEIAEAIRGNVLSLSMDAFGCHVVQKALDSVDESIKAEMVMELLRRVSETVVHRYACHVWQKLFELRWTGTPPAIMSYVNCELKGMWTQVALGETGSLVVQNIFENCVEEDKRPCIEEIMENLDTVARGQWGNWVVQHMIEHGLPGDADRALDKIICDAASYSMDQYASKVIEKLLKCCGSDVVDRYLAKICDGRPERPRIPLIDIASDAHGNYLIQYILHNSTKAQHDLVAAQIRKHMVSLRGSKWGSKCAWIVERYKHHGVSNGNNGGNSLPNSSPAGASAHNNGPFAGNHHNYSGHHHKDRRSQFNMM